MFADAKKIYHPITSHEDTIILQYDLYCQQSSSAKWLLNLNLLKCIVMSITKSTACNHDTADYKKKQGSKTSSTPILRCYEEIDLGVVFDTKQSFTEPYLYDHNQSQMTPWNNQKIILCSG